MLARLLRSSVLLAVLLTAACSGPVPSMPGALSKSPAAGMPGGLAGLVGGSSVISAEEAELRDLQRRPTAIAFPARAGVLFYDYADPLKLEDHQALVEELGKQMVESGLVVTVAQIPSQVVRPGDSLDALRKLAARFQVDVLLLVSGSQSFDRADEQPGGFFAGFGNESRWEARSTVTGLAIGVYSGTFLTPFQVVGKAGPSLLDPSSPSYAAGAYAVRKEAHTAALRRLKDEFLTGLARAKATQEAAPPPTPTPSPSATPTPSQVNSPDPSAVPTTSPAPTTSPTPIAG